MHLHEDFFVYTLDADRKRPNIFKAETTESFLRQNDEFVCVCVCVCVCACVCVHVHVLMGFTANKRKLKNPLSLF